MLRKTESLIDALQSIQSLRADFENNIIHASSEDCSPRQRNQHYVNAKLSIAKAKMIVDIIERNNTNFPYGLPKLTSELNSSQDCLDAIEQFGLIREKILAQCTLH